jgi:anti-anti-sigma factor
MNKAPEFRMTVTSGTRNGDASPYEDVLVMVAGEVDLATSPELEIILQGVLQWGSTALVVDLVGLTFLDCSGISVLVRAARLAKDTGGTLSIRNPRPNVRRVFEIAEIKEFLGVEPLGGASSRGQTVLTLR